MDDRTVLAFLNSISHLVSFGWMCAIFFWRPIARFLFWLCPRLTVRVVSVQYLADEFPEALANFDFRAVLGYNPVWTLHNRGAEIIAQCPMTGAIAFPDWMAVWAPEAMLQVLPVCWRAVLHYNPLWSVVHNTACVVKHNRRLISVYCPFDSIGLDLTRKVYNVNF